MSALASTGDSVPQYSQGNPWDSGGNIRVESYPGSRNINSRPSFLVNVSIRNLLISQMFHSPGRPEQCSSVLQPEAPLRKLSARISTCLGQQQARAMACYNFFLTYCNHNYIISSFLFLPPHTPSCSFKFMVSTSH